MALDRVAGAVVRTETTAVGGATPTTLRRRTVRRAGMRRRQPPRPNQAGFGWRRSRRFLDLEEGRVPHALVRIPPAHRRGADPPLPRREDEQLRRPPGLVVPAQVMPSSEVMACPIYKFSGHLPVNCSQAFCERCSRLGHLASGCYEFLSWECFAPMFTFQGRGQGFYYIHNTCTAKQLKERANNVVISVIEGDATARQVETYFNEYLKPWRCTARPVGNNMFVMRFHNGRDVAKACYTKHMRLHSCGALVEISSWSDAVGSKGMLEKAWIEGNIPVEKRSERNIACVSSLVGVPLELDRATVHRPDSVRVKIGCRNIDEIPPVAKAVLGDYFYDFYFEIDQILCRNKKPEKSVEMIEGGSKGHVPKKMKTQEFITEKSKDSPAGSEKSLATPKGKKCEMNVESQGLEDSEETFDNSLLIETMAREHALAAAVDNEKNDKSPSKEERLIEEESGAKNISALPHESSTDDEDRYEGRGCC